ncbi:U3 small nucleolar RNA-associated protein 14-like protein [Drosera capensis]
MTKWEGVVKRNREAPTVFFDENTDVGFSTVGAIASEFKPRTDFEKAIASLLKDSEVVEAHKDGARLLELNKVSIEDVKDRLNRNTKMRHLLFRHELKAKHIKKIKSKAYHRLKKKDKLKTAVLDMEADPESAKELARKQEFKRAEERMTLRHKNKSKWAKRILECGLDAQDEGTRAAITDQLHQHELLTRKINSLKDDSSSDESINEYDEDLDGSDEDGASRLLEKAKKKTIALVDDEDEKPLSGVMSLLFMAKAAIDEYESLMNPQKDRGRQSGQQKHVPSGRLVFGGDRKQVPAPTAEPPRSDPGNLHSDSEDEIETSKHVSMINEKSNGLAKDVDVDLDALREDSERAHDSVFTSIDDVIKDPNPKTTYDVAIFVDGSWKKMKSGDEQHAPRSGNNADVVEPNFAAQDEKEADDGSDAESEVEIIDGMLTSETKQTYELPSQEELIRRAFAADDVEEDFEKAKQEVLDEENPAPEEPKLIPGWGQWTDVQQKRGVPSWMIKEHDDAQKKRDEALKKRKEAHLKNVITSEKVDKKAEKLFSQTLPYRFTSKEVFDQSMRMPIGPEFNPASAFRALSRPKVVKTPGIIIKPIQYQEVDPNERADYEKSGDKRQWKKGKGAGNKTSNDTKRRRQ